MQAVLPVIACKIQGGPRPHSWDFEWVFGALGPGSYKRASYELRKLGRSQQEVEAQLWLQGQPQKRSWCRGGVVAMTTIFRNFSQFSANFFFDAAGLCGG